MSRYLNTVIICAAAILTLTGCGKQHDAERVVNDFLDDNLLTDNFSVSFTKLDSTRYVTDSVVKAMRTAAEKNKRFRKEIEYAPTGRQYMFMQAKVCIGQDTISQTFYLDSALTKVVSFKEN